MVQIVSIECSGRNPDTKVKPIFYRDRLNKVFEGRKDIEKYVFLSMMGPKRKGKSFLINFMICHLRELAKVIVH